MTANQISLISSELNFIECTTSTINSDTFINNSDVYAIQLKTNRTLVPNELTTYVFLSDVECMIEYSKKNNKWYPSTVYPYEAIFGFIRNNKKHSRKQVI